MLEAVSTDLDADSPTLALHFERAGDAARTWRYSQLAGNLAERSYANADAARHLQNAIEVSRRLPDVTDADRARLWTRIGGLAELAGMFAESVDAYRRAERLLRRGPARAGERAGAAGDGPHPHRRAHRCHSRGRTGAAAPGGHR